MRIWEFNSTTQKRLQTSSTFIFWTIAIVTISISLWTHQLAGFTFPNPWNDEPWLLWGSVSFMENNSPFSEYLNFDRPVFAFPVYGITLGLLFKLTGFSFALARWISWGCTMVAYLALLRIIRRFPFSLVAVGIASLFFLGSSTVVAGNMARPEAFVLLLSSIAYLLLADQKYWKGLAVSAGCGLFHVAGIFFFLGAIGTVAMCSFRQRSFPLPSRSDWIVITISSLIVLAHVAIILTHWQYYWMDTKATVQVDPLGNAFSRLFFSPMTPWYVGAVLLAAVFLWKAPHDLPWIAFGGICLLIPGIRLQMWYSIYLQMGFLMFAISLPLATWMIMTHLLPFQTHLWRLIRTSAYFTTLFLLLVYSYRNGWITGPNHYPQKLEWGWGMKFDKADYMQPADISAIANALQPYASHSRIYRIYFMPDADALFCYGHLPTNVIPYQAIWTSTPADLFLFRLSRHYPDWWRTQYVEAAAHRKNISLDQPFYSRDGTESWYLFDATVKPAMIINPTKTKPLEP